MHPLIDDPTARAPHPALIWQQWWSARPVSTEVQQLASRQGWVVTTRQLALRGWTTNDVRREVRRGTLWSPARGVLTPVAADDPDPFVYARREHTLRSTAGARLRDDHVIDGRSAAILHGLPTRRIPDKPELAGPNSAGRHRQSHTHAMRLRPTDLTTWFGAAVTSPARTVADLARRDADDAIMAADAALGCGLVTPNSLGYAVDGAAGWPGVGQARVLVASASSLAESPLESLTRWRLLDAGFPPPVLQLPVAGYRVDLAWPEFKLLLECDGRSKYTGDELWREKRRERVLQALGWRVERVVWDDVTRLWSDTCARLTTLFPAGAVISRHWK